MAVVSEDERNDAVYSPSSFTEKTNSKQQLTGTLTSSSSSSPSLPTLPFDIIPQILIRLPVKPLLQFKCVSKSWNSIISDPKFAEKHLTHSSTTHSLHCISYSNNKYVLNSYSFDSVLTNDTTIDITNPRFPSKDDVFFLGSCNGILCVVNRCGNDLFRLHLWNPSIRKFKELPFLERPQNIFSLSMTMTMYGFGFDPVSDNYKIVVVFADNVIGHKSELKVLTLGTDSWKSVLMFSFDGECIQPSGKYVSGTINWLISMDINQGQCSIASIDLRDEYYQEVLLPDYFEVNEYTSYLSVFRNCLCMISGEDVWVMKEYGNNESWTKLFTISNMQDSLTSSYPCMQAKYVFEDDQVLIESVVGWIESIVGLPHKYIFYNFRNGTSNVLEFENTLEVCVESLISSCF